MLIKKPASAISLSRAIRYERYDADAPWIVTFPLRADRPRQPTSSSIVWPVLPAPVRSIVAVTAWQLAAVSGVSDIEEDDGPGGQGAVSSEQIRWALVKRTWCVPLPPSSLARSTVPSTPASRAR